MKKIVIVMFCTLCILSCTKVKSNDQTKELTQLRAEIDSLKKASTLQTVKKEGQIATFLTFQKEDAERAMNFYVSLFEDAKIIDIQRWGKASSSKEGTIMYASFKLKDQLFMCSDSPAIHKWGFTPAISIYLECNDETEQKRLFTSLSEKGTVLMPLNNYGFSKQFGFVQDQFGVSWQLNLQ